MDSDDELLAACRSGDAKAWASLVDRYHRLVRSIALSYGLQPESAEEVVQVVFAALVRQVDRFHEGTRLSAWLGVVTRRHVWRVLAVQRREFLTDDLSTFDRGSDAADNDVVDAEWLRAAMARLSPKCRALLESLYLGDDQPYAEVSAELGIPIGSIGPTRARCLSSLRQLLGLGDSFDDGEQA